LPDTNIKNPNNYTKIAPAPTISQTKLGWVAPAVTVTIIPIIHTRTVLVTSPIDLANALIYLVTDTPAMLNVAIEKIPKITKNKRAPFEKIAAK
jgi:hypothetical protein